MKETIKIIFPPQFEPFQPYLSLPYLKALLKKYRYKSTCFDANVDFYWWLFNSMKTKVSILCPSKKYLDSNISKAIEIIKSQPKDIAEYRWAINLAEEYLKAISPPGVEISFTSLNINNKYSSDDLSKYLKAKDNIFKNYFVNSADKIIEKSKSQIYFFSIIVIDQLAAALTFAREIKLRKPDSKIIVGGPLISHIYQQINSISWIRDLFDIITPKEGNQAIKEIFDADYVYEGHLTPDFNDLQLNEYFSYQTVLPYLIAHGCSWGRCAFCSHHLSYNRFKESRIEDVVSDISIYQKRYGIKYISFSDEYLAPQQLEQLSNLMVQKGLNIRWSTFVRAESRFMDEKFSEKLYDAGCRLLMFGFESASQQILNSMKKGTLAEYYPAILRSCKKSNIALRIDFMLGFPNETRKDIQKTFAFIKKNKDFIDTPFSSYSVAVFELRRGTPILDELEQYNIKSIAPLRGNLDNQFEFVDERGIRPKMKKEWRERMINYSKHKLKFKLICPRNKTHQLILKDLFDDGYFELPITEPISTELHKLKGKWNPGVEIEYKNSHFKVTNFATGGEIQISKELAKIMEGLFENDNLESVYHKQKVLDKPTFIKLLNFLQRNDYLEICHSEQREIFYSLDKTRESPTWPTL